MNVWGDSVGCGVVEALTRSTLAEMDRQEQEEMEKELGNGKLAIDANDNTRGVSGYGHYNPAYMSGENTML